MIDHKTYSNYVRHSGDLEGLLAYALYKGDKLQFRASSDNPAHLDGFIMTANLPGQVDAYRAKAAMLLEDMTEYALGQSVEEIKADFDSRLKVLEKSLGQQGFWNGVLQNTVANIIAGVLAVAAVVLMFGSKINLWGQVVDWLSK